MRRKTLLCSSSGPACGIDLGAIGKGFALEIAGEFAAGGGSDERPDSRRHQHGLRDRHAAG